MIKHNYPISDIRDNLVTSYSDHPQIRAKSSERIPSQSIPGIIYYREDDFSTEFDLGLTDKYKIIQAFSHLDCILNCMSNQIDIIIVCFQNSSKDNIHICSQLKTNTLTRDVPVIVMFSKRISVHNKLLFFKAGVNEILQIPEDSPLLDCRINNLFIHAENLKKKFSRTTYSQDFNMLDGDGEFMEKLKKVLRGNFSDPTLNTALLCFKMNMSRSTLFRKCKESTGYSPSEIINNFRLTIAARVLREQKTSISGLAYELGYSCPSYFTKLFRMRFKMAPTHFSDLKYSNIIQHLDNRGYKLCRSA